MTPAAADRRRAQATDRLVGQARLLSDWFEGRTADELASQTALPGWDVFTLGAHLVMMLQGVAVLLDRPTRDRPVPLHAYVAQYRGSVDDIGERTRTTANSLTDLPEELRAAVGRVAERLAGPWPEVIAGWRGPLRTEDFITSRIFELVTHSDDLNSSALVTAGQSPPVPIHPQALAAATRGMAAVLADRFPGRTIEVRVPPYAAVQCGTADHAAPGPAHTRGTPPNVVEIAPLIFVRLCTGRARWVDAVSQHGVTASGIRADLSEHLPLLS